MTIDLKKFCSTDESRQNMLEPFTIGKYTYATNGHIAVMVPRIESAVVADAETILSVGIVKLFNGFKNNEFESIAGLEVPAAVVTQMDCECHGHECPTCNCMNECEKCEGQGEVIRTTTDSVQVGIVHFDSYYISMIKSLPDPEFQMDVKPLEFSFFRFDGGCGAVMPLRVSGTQTRYEPLRPK